MKNGPTRHPRQPVLVYRGLDGPAWVLAPERMVEAMKRHLRRQGVPVVAVVRVKKEMQS
jgi:hypothetical protein